MKRIIISLGCVASILCGCGKSNTDAEKIESLSKKVDAMLINQSITISNEFVIFKEVAAMKIQMTNLPTFEQVNALDFYYYTNLNEGVSLIVNQSQLNSKMGFMDASNNLVMFGEISDMNNSVKEIQDNAFATWSFLKSDPPLSGKDINQIEMESNVEKLNQDVDDIQEDLRKIKARLGIIY